MATKPEVPIKETPEKPAELVKLAEGVGEALFGEKKRETKPKAQPAVPAAEAVAAPGTAAELTPPKPGETPPKPEATPPAPPKKPEPSIDERIQATARKTANEVVEALRTGEQPPEPSSPTAEPELSPEDMADYKGFQKLETINGRRKGIADRFVEFVKARQEYEDNWTKENEGKQFNPDDAEHEGFWKEWKEFDSPTVAEELANAKIEMRIDDRLEQRLRPIEEANRRRVIMQQLQPTIAKQVLGQLQKLAGLVNPELAQKLVDDKGNFRMSADDIKRLEEEYPVEVSVLDRLVTGDKNNMGRVIPETSLINLLGVVEQTAYAEHTGFRIDPKDPVHSRVLDYMIDFESAMETAPDEVKLARFKGKGGDETVKEWIKTEDLVKLKSSIIGSKLSEKAKQKKIADLDNRYWTVGQDNLEKMIIGDIAEAAKNQISRINKLADRKAGRLPPIRTFNQPQPAPAAPSKPKPPTLSTPDVVSPGGTGPSATPKLSESFNETMFGTP